jgi:hypothetical protein
VSCTSATACTAVGYYYINNNFNLMTLAERWDGTSWTIQPTPSAGSSSLSGVSCTSAVACTAVGASGMVDGDCVFLAERWDGSTWTHQTIATPSGFEDGCLNGVSCTSATSCTAVGYYLNDHGGASFDYETLAERWDGSTWTVQTTANPNPSNPGGATLWGVSCTSATSCTAVGSPPYGSHVGTLAESWNGSSWTIQTTPNPSGGGSLSGVSCTAVAACTATGYYVSGGGVDVTLAERYSG